MADFLVLEEDGTSHLELEESSSDFLLEDGSLTFDTAGFGRAGLTAFAPSPPTVPSNATWQVGTITVPSGTGTHAVTGLGGTPQAVFFYGTAWLTEDTSVTSAGPGVFRGMAAPNYLSPGTIEQNVACVTPTGDAHGELNGYCILTQDSVTETLLYEASFSSFDSDGFTVNFTVGASGGYKVVYCALMDVQNSGAYVGAATNLTVGWKAGALMCHGAWDGPNVGAQDRTQEWYGSAAYPGTFGPSWMGAGLSVQAFPTAPGGGQWNSGLYNFAPDSVIASSNTFIGPFLSTGNVVAYPSGAGLTDMSFNPGSGNAGMIAFWDDEDNATGTLVPATSTSGTVTVSGLSFAPGLVIGYSNSDEPGGQGGGNRGAAGFSVATPDFQWCALVDGVSSRGAFQSFQRGFVDTVNGSNVHAGTIELTADGFILTTEEDDVAPSAWVWHAFGHPEQFPVWIPQSYRRRN